MCYNCSSAPYTYLGCVAGNVRDYCYVFGKEVGGTIPFLSIVMSILIIAGALICASLYWYNRIKFSKQEKTNENLQS